MALFRGLPPHMRRKDWDDMLGRPVTKAVIKLVFSFLGKQH